MSHISRQRIERLIKDEILPDLDFLDFDTCVDCINGKLVAKVRNVKIDRCTKLLGVIHKDICGPLTPPAMGDHKYSSRSLMIIPVMVLLRSFVRSLIFGRFQSFQSKS